MTTFNLRAVKLRPGEQFRDRIAVALEPLELGGQRYEASPDAPEAELTITRVSSGTMFELALATALGGPCYRCLGDAAVEVRIRDRQYQATSPDSEETTTPYLVESRLDLSGWARDAIALAVPEKILCREGCAGLCPGCGANLNLEPCRCGPAKTDVRWSKLSELKDRLGA
jgi:uncharacterized protein